MQQCQAPRRRRRRCGPRPILLLPLAASHCCIVLHGPHHWLCLQGLYGGAHERRQLSCQPQQAAPDVGAVDAQLAALLQAAAGGEQRMELFRSGGPPDARGTTSTGTTTAAFGKAGLQQASPAMHTAACAGPPEILPA